MAEKTFNTRIIHKHDTEASWVKKTTFVPKQGEIIVYDIDASHNYERLKIGDGKTAINSLPFVDGALRDYVDTELDALSNEINAIDALVGDTSVSSQISTAIANEIKTKVDKTTTINGNALSSNVTLDASDVGAVSTSTRVAITGGATGTATSFGNATQINVPITDIKESYISWGGKNLTGSVSPLDDIAAGTITNCFAFIPEEGITAEYTRDGGSTWTAVVVNSGLFTQSLSDSIPLNKPYTTNDKVRITIDNSVCQHSCVLNKLLFKMYCVGVTARVVVEYFYNNNLKSTETFDLSSSWNSIARRYTFYPAYTLRFTFEITEVREHSNPGFTINKIIGLGEAITGSNMAKTGHIYDYDDDQNVTFPAIVSATRFIENGTNISSRYVPLARTINGKALSSNITLSASDVDADASGAANTALTNAKSYTDTEIAAMVGDQPVSEQLNEVIDYIDGEIVEANFYVTFTKQSNTVYTADKQYTEVETAYQDGQNVMGLLNLGTNTIYHIPVLYCVPGYGIAFHTSLESSEPITLAYGADGTIVVQVYDKLASKTDISDAISKITHPVASVNGQTGAVTLTASSVGADSVGSATAALNSAKSYTDTKISSMVGDKTVSTQITNALDSKADAKHNHKIADITDIGDASVSYAVSAGGVAWANVSGKPSEYTPATHSHAIADVTDLQKTLNAKVPTTRTVNGKALSSNITLAASDVGADASGSAASALASAKSYTDAEITEWVGDKTVSAQISSALTGKADTNHTHDDMYYTETEMNSKLNAKLSLSGGTLTGSLTLDNSATSQSGEPHIQWATVGGNKPYTGFAHDQSDGTFIICSMEKDTTTNGVKYYKNGLAIGGGSGNLFWKGSKVVTAADQLEATTSAAGLMSADDKKKLDGIATGATKVTVDNALSSTSTNPVQNKIVNAAISNLNTLVGDTAVATQIGDAIATKADVGHTHTYAGSSSAGGAATSANKLNTDAGSVTQPVYFENGIPKKTTYTLGASVPSGAKFTDTVYTHPSYTARTGSPTQNYTPGFGDSFTVSQIVSDSTGHITALNSRTIKIPSSVATTTTAGLMSAADKNSLNSIATLVGDTAVSTQISNAISNHQHVIADISNIVISATEPSSPTTGMLWFDIS